MKFGIEPRLLEKQYKHLQWKVHPDRLARHSEQEREYSANSATQINMAYSVLRSPLSRANYMVRWRSIHFSCVYVSE
jgi:molecular chaperone HscB